MSKLVAEIQDIKAGNDFDGTTPTTDSDIDYGVKRFLPSPAGGLFDCLFDSTVDFSSNNRVRRIKAIRLKLDGNTSAWSISLSRGATDTVILSGTNEVSIVLTDEIEVLPDQRLKVSTTGATGALHAEVVYGISPNSL